MHVIKLPLTSLTKPLCHMVDRAKSLSRLISPGSTAAKAKTPFDNPALELQVTVQRHPPDLGHMLMMVGSGGTGAPAEAAVAAVAGCVCRRTRCQPAAAP